MTEPHKAPADLDGCADEPIHIPGSIQPHGVLIAVSEPDLVVRVVSANCADLLAVDAEDLLGRPLGDGSGGLRRSDLESLPQSDHPAEQFPVTTRLLVDGHERTVDAVLHRTDGLLVVEIEPLSGPPPSARTYQLTRASISRIQRSRRLDELYQVAVEEVSRLTGFDRVMLYRFDDDWNGEVVAEDRRADGDLISFHGLHYPASDIPAQARRLYRSSWLRLIADVGYVPVPLVPETNPRSGRPLDLSHAGLRSVSPVHLEYLRNMGVAASMSVSLIDDGELWGLIACHHYRGPLRPSYEIRAATEFLGQTLSLRLVETARRESERRLTLSRSTLATLNAAAREEIRPAAVSLTRRTRSVLDLVAAGGAAVSLEGIDSSVGVVPSIDAVRALVARARADGGEVRALAQAPEELAAVGEITERACGVLVVSLPDDQYIVWCRPELIQTVAWGGDPHTAETREGDHGRINPRKSFDKWQENLRGYSAPWTADDVELATVFRRSLLDTLYDRSRRLASTADVLQRSLLPDHLPEVTGWTMAAEYQPRAGGQVGGDWYDAVRMPDGKVVCVLGDVAGHGVGVAGSMGQLRNGLRAYVVEEDSPALLLQRLDRLVARLLPDIFATAVVMALDPVTGLVRVASAGHPPPCLVPPSDDARLMALVPAPPLGAAPDGTAPQETTHMMMPGEQVVLYSDGLVERREEDISHGLDRLLRMATGQPDPGVLCDRLVADCRDPAAEDDASILVLRRDP